MKKQNYKSDSWRIFLNKKNILSNLRSSIKRFGTQGTWNSILEKVYDVLSVHFVKYFISQREIKKKNGMLGSIVKKIWVKKNLSEKNLNTQNSMEYPEIPKKQKCEKIVQVQNILGE